MILPLDVMLGQLKGMLDSETTMLLGKIVLKAVQSGNANLYLKTRLQRVLDEVENIKSSPPVRVTSKVVPPGTPVKRSGS